MNIKEISIKNSSINIDKLNLNFSDYGIYRLSGANGTGKTTLLEKIIFDEYEVDFEFDEDRLLWKRSRESLFTYISQNLINLPIKVADYLDLANPDSVSVKEMFELFGLSTNLMKEKFCNLSGGEKRKLSIIRGLCRNTKYIFIDEPTNDLDNESVARLCNILSQYSEKHVIVLVSHDDRLNLNYKAEYNVNGEKQIFSTNCETKAERKPALIKKKIKTGKIVRLLKNYSTVIIILIAVLSLSGLFSYTEVYWRDELSDEDLPMSGVVLVSESETHESVLDTYIKREKLNVDVENNNKYITWADIPDIVKDNPEMSVLVSDVAYIKEIQEKILNDELISNFSFISFPEAYLHYYDYSIIDIGLNMFEGSYPRDNAKEIALSKRMLCDKWGYTEKNVKDAIGKAITINVNGTDVEYTIVGFTYYDYLLISFNSEESFGVYTYREDTYSDFAYKQILFEQSWDGNVAMVSEIVLVTGENGERSVLNYVLENYPCNIVLSNYYVSVFKKQQRVDAFGKIAAINLAMAGILTAVFILLNNYSAKFNSTLLWDCGNVMIDRKKTVLVYRLVNAALYFYVTAMMLMSVFIFSEVKDLTALIILINSIIMFVPVMLINIFKKPDISRK